MYTTSLLPAHRLTEVRFRPEGLCQGVSNTNVWCSVLVSTGKLVCCVFNWASGMLSWWFVISDAWLCETLWIKPVKPQGNGLHLIWDLNWFRQFSNIFQDFPGTGSGGRTSLRKAERYSRPQRVAEDSCGTYSWSGEVQAFWAFWQRGGVCPSMKRLMNSCVSRSSWRIAFACLNPARLLTSLRAILPRQGLRWIERNIVGETVVLPGVQDRSF